MWSLWLEANLCSRFFRLFFLSFFYMYCLWRPRYQQGRGWIHRNRLSPATFVWVSHTSTWISNVRYCGRFSVQCVKRGDFFVIVDICKIVINYCLDFLFINSGLMKIYIFIFQRFNLMMYYYDWILKTVDPSTDHCAKAFTQRGKINLPRLTVVIIDLLRRQ